MRFEAEHAEAKQINLPVATGCGGLKKERDSKIHCKRREMKKLLSCQRIIVWRWTIPNENVLFCPFGFYSLCGLFLDVLEFRYPVCNIQIWFISTETHISLSLSLSIHTHTRTHTNCSPHPNVSWREVAFLFLFLIQFTSIQAKMVIQKQTNIIKWRKKK